MTRTSTDPVRVLIEDGRSVTAVRAGMHGIAEARFAFALDASAAELNMTAVAVLNEHADAAGRSLRRLGAEVVVSNDADWLYVAVSAPVEALESSLRGVSDLLSVTPDEAAVRAAAQRTAYVLGVAADDLGFIADTETNARVYGEQHPYGRRLDVSALSTVDADLLVRTLYDTLAAADAHAVIAADAPPEVCAEAAATVLATLTSHAATRRTPVPVPISRAGRTDIEVAGTSRAQLRLVWPVPGRDGVPHGVRELIAAELGGDHSSRLFREVRETRGLCYAIRCRVVSARHASACIVSTSTTAAAADVAMESIVETVAGMIADPPGEARVEEIGRRLRLARAIATSTPRGLADRMLRDAVGTGESTNAPPQVRPDEIAASVAAVLSPERRIDVAVRGVGRLRVV